MEARAIHRYVGTSPRKMRLVIDLIRGKGVDEALNVLHFVPKHAAKTAEKVLRSAVSNLQTKEESGRVDTATLYVKEAFVDGGPMLKRISPAPMGRAYRIRKRSNHITIVIAQREQTTKAPVSRQTKTVQVEPKVAEKPTGQKDVKAKNTTATAKKKTKAETSPS